VFGRNLPAVVLALSVLLLDADSAMAYVGPGADVAFISYAMTLLAWMLAAFSAVLLWPIYALIRKVRGRRSRAEPGNQEKSAAPPLAEGKCMSALPE
jgi:hypothetical protein